jgi:hypothetical protein
MVNITRQFLPNHSARLILPSILNFLMFLARQAQEASPKHFLYNHGAGSGLPRRNESIF